MNKSFSSFCHRLASGDCFHDSLETDHPSEPILRSMFIVLGPWRVAFMQNTPDLSLRVEKLEYGLEAFAKEFIGDKFEPEINFNWIDLSDSEAVSALTSFTKKVFFKNQYRLVRAAFIALADIPPQHYSLSLLPISSIVLVSDPELQYAVGYFFGNRALKENWSEYVKLLTDESSELQFRLGLLKVLSLSFAKENYGKLLELLPKIKSPDTRYKLGKILVKVNETANNLQRIQLRSSLENDKLDALRRMACQVNIL
jgi:hypothetical protein